MNMENSQLQNLMSYTVFHIGVYISLLGVILGGGISGKLNYKIFRIPFAFYLIAGACGGVIASSIPEFNDFDKFNETRIGLLGLDLLKYKVWAKIEHISFWIGTLSIAIPFLFVGVKYFTEKTSNKIK